MIMYKSKVDLFIEEYINLVDKHGFYITTYTDECPLFIRTLFKLEGFINSGKKAADLIGLDHINECC